MFGSDLENPEEANPSEITLGTGKLLGLFFALVILCGLSLATGFAIGRNTVRQPALAANIGAGNAAPLSSTASLKPAAGSFVPQPACDTPNPAQAPASAPAATAPAAAEDMTFYNSVKQKEPHAKLTPAPEPPKAAAPVPARATSSTSALGAGFLVQIAAVSKKEDADLLRETLQKQHYPVIILNPPGDRLYHVQVGPYADQAQADAIRARLHDSGFNNAFLRR